ncbi:MAG: DUF2855 family protein, partial [Myxococcota bacterium]
LLDDFLATQENAPSTLVLTSASSKTAIGLAYMAAQRDGVRVVGLTSAQNTAFVERLGLYDEVRSYDDVAGLDAAPSAYVDFAGEPELTRQVHGHLGAHLLHSVWVGATHWEAAPDALADLPGPPHDVFFAPTYGAKRSGQLGPGVLAARMGGAWSRFIGETEAWLHVLRVRGPEALATVYEATLDGRVMPHEGYVLSLWDEEGA